MDEGRNKWYDEIWDRGYTKGLEDGAAEQRRAGGWNVPYLKPEDGEPILAMVRPFNRKLRRLCKKNKLRFLQLEGFFIKKETVMEAYGGDDPDLYDDILLINKRDCADWSDVELWISLKLPDGFKVTEDKDART